jgi:NAD(P)-dependent dehydrogenase (short-subunit alcohol dehydrogenase family)
MMVHPSFPSGSKSNMRTLIIGNGDGIGLALTKRLLDDGGSVVGVSRRFLGCIGARHAQHVLDVLDPKFPELIATVVAEAGPIDTLVYCAGIGELFETSGVDRDGDTIRVNLAALADAVAAVLPGMRAQGRGRIIGVSSIGDRASPDAPSYGASKAGMTAYLLGLRRPLGRLGVRVSAVRFGFVDTKMAKSKIRPMMITTDRAAEVMLDVIKHGPAIRTYPLAMEILVSMATALTSWRMRK